MVINNQANGKLMRAFVLGYGVHQDDELVSHIHRDPMEQSKEDGNFDTNTEMPSSTVGEAMSTSSNLGGSTEAVKKEPKVCTKPYSATGDANTLIENIGISKAADIVVSL